MTDRDRRTLTDARLEAVTSDLRDRRAAGARVDDEDIDAAIGTLPELQCEVMRRAVSQVRAGRRRPNLARVARETGRSRATVREAYDLARVALGIELT